MSVCDSARLPTVSTEKSNAVAREPPSARTQRTPPPAVDVFGVSASLSVSSSGSRSAGTISVSFATCSAVSGASPVSM
eukprot:1240588-Pleurochrysis_carterae.AAC.2